MRVLCFRSHLAFGGCFLGAIFREVEEDEDEEEEEEDEDDDH